MMTIPDLDFDALGMCFLDLTLDGDVGQGVPCIHLP